MKQQSSNPFNTDFWNNRYQKNETGWDLRGISPPLKSIIDSLADKSMNILIPGCGNAYEASYLFEKGFENVTLLDISTLAFNGVPETIPQSWKVVGDFFTHQGAYDVILEQTFFCAINPELRESLANKVFNLLKPNGIYTGVLFNKDFGNPQPPFGGSIEEYLGYFQPLLNINKLELCTNSILPRQGTELLFEFQKTI